MENVKHLDTIKGINEQIRKSILLSRWRYQWQKRHL